MPLVSTLAAFISSGFFLSHPVYILIKGRSRLGAGCGLVGTALALPVGLWIKPLSLPAGVAFAAAMTVLSIILSHLAHDYYRQKDDSRIVIDEFAGYLWALVLLPTSLWVLTASFALFRVLDVTKPFGIRRIENLPGGWGCVLDDVACGLVTAAVIKIFLLLT